MLGETIIISSVFCGAYFFVERMCTRTRSFSDYLMIWILVIGGMSIQSAYAEPSVDDFYNYKLNRDFVVAKCLDKDASISKEASIYKFPPKGFDRSTMNENCTINEYGKSLVRQCGRDSSRLELQRHLALSDIWTARLQECSLIPNNPDQERIAQMIVSSALAGKGNPYRTVLVILSELATHYAFDSIASYYDMKACAQYITWHDSCFQAFLDHCVNNHY